MTTPTPAKPPTRGPDLWVALRLLAVQWVEEARAGDEAGLVGQPGTARRHARELDQVLDRWGVPRVEVRQEETPRTAGEG